MARKTALVICAHNDDQVIGAGGTLARLAKEGVRIRAIIFSFGELSHPHLKPEVIVAKRVREALMADKVLGGKGVAYLGLKEGRFKEEESAILRKLKAAIKSERPSWIFTHSSDDPHPDHRVVNKYVRKLIEKQTIKIPVFTFEVWNILSVRERSLPVLWVDVSKTFETKMKALSCHKSQKLAITTLFWKIWLKARLAGLRRGTKYCETFRRIDGLI